MKTLRIALTTLFLFSLTTTVAAQSAAQSDAQQTFEKLKTLAGTWEGTVTTTPKTPEIEGTLMTVTFRVTSMGHTLMHEMTGVGRPDDPITMFYLVDDQLELTHYCDAGNRPRMRGKMSKDGKRVEYDFVDLTGGTHYGHMHGAVIQFVDEDRHSEDWTFMLPGGKSVRAHVDLRRKK